MNLWQHINNKVPNKFEICWKVEMTVFIFVTNEAKFPTYSTRQTIFTAVLACMSRCKSAKNSKMIFSLHLIYILDA